MSSAPSRPLCVGSAPDVLDFGRFSYDVFVAEKSRILTGSEPISRVGKNALTRIRVVSTFDRLAPVVFPARSV